MQRNNLSHYAPANDNAESTELARFWVDAWNEWSPRDERIEQGTVAGHRNAKGVN